MAAGEEQEVWGNRGKSVVAIKVRGENRGQKETGERVESYEKQEEVWE